MSYEPFQTDERSAFHGRCVAYVKADAAPGLKSASIALTAGEAK
jgi:hypothetical protein